MVPPRPSRLLFDQVAQLVRAASKPRTAQELSEVTGLHLRTVYRLLRALPDGFRLEVQETPRPRGSGRPTRRYRIWALGSALAAVADELREITNGLGGAPASARRTLLERLERAVTQVEDLAGRRRPSPRSSAGPRSVKPGRP